MSNAKNVIRDSGIQFGTSGARGLVEQFSDEVCSAFTVAFIDTLKKEFQVEKIYVGIDRRPSSLAMAKACCLAVEVLDYKAEYCGVLPTPALAYQAMQNNQPCIMITGSHIPFDRNGIKFYRPDGEITKKDEKAILNSSAEVPTTSQEISFQVNSRASDFYLERYKQLIPAGVLKGKRIGIYEHSSAGRDLYGELFSSLGAHVVSLGRSDEFVPIDTEAVRKEDIEQGIKWAKEYNLDFLFSTDGDGDRPLIADEKGQWLRGDIVGLLTANYLGINALAVPVSCNTAIEKSELFKKVLRTRIGSPYVIEGMQHLRSDYEKIAGFEANGGFLLESNIPLNGQILKSLPTRDALLPVIAIIGLSVEQSVSVSELIDSFPKRFTASDRIKNFPTEKSKELLAKWADNSDLALNALNLESYKVVLTDTTDGLRLTLDNGDIVHLRPSGNAPELRCYAESDSEKQASMLVESSLELITEL